MDPARALAMDVLTGRNYADYEAIFAAAESDRTISVLMLGMNAEGAEFLKTAVWFYQRYGYRVCFHVFCGKDDLWSEERLRRKCPDLSQTFDPTSGDACHDIRFFADLDKLFESPDLEELRRTKLAFVSLGDDGKNVNTVIALRSLFDRIHGEKRENSKRQPIPYIYCVVRSDSRADSLRAGEGLRNYKGEHFHIDFVGAFSEQYSYDRIRRIRQTEAEGFYYHLDWTRKESLLRRHYELSVRENTDGNFVAEIAAEMARGGFAWNDGAYFTDDTRTVVKAEKLKQEAEKYMNESYCRRSSIAKLEHKAAVTRFYPDTLAHSPVCGCDACREMRITEHMRWNAYMRGLGYRRADARYDRAMVHNDLKPWGELPCRERYKD